MIDHHVKEEEGEIMPKARKAIDTKAVGADLAARKAELASEMGLEEPRIPRTRNTSSGRRAMTGK